MELKWLKKEEVQTKSLYLYNCNVRVCQLSEIKGPGIAGN